MTSEMKTIQTHSRYRDMQQTVAECLDSIRRGMLFVNERLARLIMAEIAPGFRLDASYPAGVNGGRCRLIVTVDRGILVDEFRSWKEAVLSIANENGL